MGTKLDRVGEISYNSYGSRMEIINYKSCHCITVRFDDGFTKDTKYQHFKDGVVSNPNDKSVFNKGKIGEGIYNVTENNKQTIAYMAWYAMLQRCYDIKLHKKEPTYVECTVCEEWLNYQNFAKWYYENIYIIKGEKLGLDKDILVKGNKIYSPKTCILVPQCINSLFTKADSKRGDYPIGVYLRKSSNKYESLCHNGEKQVYLGSFETPNQAFNTYKIFKEEFIKEIAEKYKSEIPEALYNALYVYEVEITD